MSHQAAIAAVRDEKCISLTTFKRDGSRVATPIWLNVTGPVFTGTARVLSKSEIDPVLAAKKRRYFLFRIIQLFRSDQVAIEITPDR